MGDGWWVVDGSEDGGGGGRWRGTARKEGSKETSPNRVSQRSRDAAMGVVLCGNRCLDDGLWKQRKSSTSSSRSLFSSRVVSGRT